MTFTPKRTGAPYVCAVLSQRSDGSQADQQPLVSECLNKGGTRAGPIQITQRHRRVVPKQKAAAAKQRHEQRDVLRIAHLAQSPRYPGMQH